MHEFAVLAFGGLAVWLAGHILSQYGREMGRASGYVLMALLGVGYAYLLDYSLFASWHMGVRNATIGHIASGFMVGAFAMVWDEAFDFMRAYGHGHGQSEDKKLRRAA